MKNLRSALVTIATVGLLASCSSESADVVSHIEGLITDVFGMPISGAVITIPSTIAGENASLASDENGYYRFEFRGIGTYQLIVQADGYARAVTTGSISDPPDVGGDFEVNTVRNVTLYKLGATLRGRITRTRGATAPLSELPLQLRIDDATVKDPSLKLTAMTDEEGRYLFEGMPSGLSATMFIPAHDVDGDGTPDTGATSRSVSLGHDTDTVFDHSVSDFDGPRAVWSNADDSILAADATIQVFYSVAMDPTPNRLSVELRQSSPSSFQVFERYELSENGQTLTITPAEPLTAGARYSVSVTAHALSGQKRVSSSYSFTVESDAAGPPAPQNLRRDDSGDDITYGQSSFRIAWDSVLAARTYHVYMRRDQGDITDWVLTREVRNSISGAIRETVSVPSALRGDGSVFEGGAKLMVAVTAVVDGLEGQLSQAIALGDEDCPRITSVRNEVGSRWDNSDGETSRNVALQVRFSEPLANNSPIKLEIDADGVAGSAFRFEWTDADEGIFRGTIPPNTDGGGRVMVDISGASDRSGNRACAEDATGETTVF